MKVTRRVLERRAVIEAYAVYDCSKKHQSVPDFSKWDWSQADAIDRELERATLKKGVLAGYRLWEMVEVNASDIRACAVEGSIFPGQARALGRIEAAGALDGWRPRAENSWYEAIEKGEPLDEDAPLILRPALSAEAPAAWYVEDGSGRAIALLKNRAAFDRSDEFFAIGYLGVEPDQGSSFMRQPPFQELLGKFGSGQR